MQANDQEGFKGGEKEWHQGCPYSAGRRHSGNCAARNKRRVAG